MKLSSKTVKLSIEAIIFGLVLLLNFAPVYAGTGPGSNAIIEGGYIEKISTGSTSTIVRIHTYDTSTIGNTSVGYGFFRGSLLPNGTTPPAECYYGGSNGLGGGNSDTNTLNNFDYPVAATTGTISYYIYPYGGTDNYNPNISSTPPQIYGSCPNFISSSSNWTSAYWDIDTLDLDSESSTQIIPTISILGLDPSDTDGLPIPSPDKIFVDVNDLNPLNQYYIFINANFVSSSEPTDSSSSLNFQIGSTISGESVYVGFGVMMLDSQDGSYVTLNPPPQTLRSWTLNAFLCEDAYCASILSTDSVSITSLSPNSPGSPANSSTIPNNPWSDEIVWEDIPYVAKNGTVLPDKYVNDFASGLNQSWCGANPEGWDDYMYWSLCKMGEVLIRPSTSTGAFFTTGLNRFKNVYPLKYLYDIQNIASTRLGAGARSLTDTTLSVDYSDMEGWNNATFTILSSSTLVNIVGQETKEDIFDVQGYIFWLVAAGIAIKQILG